MIWIISGTQDGREIGAALADREQSKPEGERREILMTVVSQYGKVLAAHKGLDIEVGRFREEDMLRVIREKGISLILDASHPYAAIVSETARAACTKAGIDYVRYERAEIPAPEYDKLYDAALVAAAVGYVCTYIQGMFFDGFDMGNDNYWSQEVPWGQLGKSILLTTGSKTLATFVEAKALEGKEIWARVLPTSNVIKMCEDLGMKAKYILALQGPFSYEMNLAMIHDYHADVMVTKNSGLIGGSDTKLKAAMDAGISVIVIDKPKAKLDGAVVFSTVEGVLNYMEEHYGFHQEP